MNSTRPGRSRSSSSGWGSLTLSTSSARAHTSSAVGHDLGPGGAVVVVGDRRSDAGVAFDDHRRTVHGELVHAVGGDGDPVLTFLPLAGNADDERLGHPATSIGIGRAGEGSRTGGVRRRRTAAIASIAMATSANTRVTVEISQTARSSTDVGIGRTAW